MRRNLDPFSIYTDEDVWKALEKVNTDHIYIVADLIIFLILNPQDFHRHEKETTDVYNFNFKTFKIFWV